MAKGLRTSNERVSADAPVDYSGLIAPVAKVEKKTEIVMAADALFEHDKSTLRDVGKMKLDELNQQLTKPNVIGNQSILDFSKANGGKIPLHGNTDATGSDAYNLKLGQKRAEEVKNYLVSKNPDYNGVLEAVSFGEHGQSNKFKDADIAKMKSAGMTKKQIHQEIEIDRNVIVQLKDLENLANKKGVTIQEGFNLNAKESQTIGVLNDTSRNYASAKLESTTLVDAAVPLRKRLLLIFPDK